MSALFRWSRVPGRAAAAMLLLATTVAGQANVVPADVQMPGTQPGEISGLQDVTRCDNCHAGYDAAVEPYHNWSGSLMAQATRDPLFWATVAVAEQDFTGAGDLCLRCHTPDAWIAGNSTPTDGSAIHASQIDGVACDACHRMTNPDTSEWLGVQNAPFLAHDGGSPPTGFYGSGMYVLGAVNNDKFGPYADADANHGFFQSQFHRSAEFCGTCHDVSNPAVGDLAPNHGAQVPLDPGTYLGVPGGDVADKAAFNNPPYAYGVVERTFSEHQSSGWADLRVEDYGTLPPELQAGAVEVAYQAALAAGATPEDPLNADYVDGAPRYFTCQSCHMPPVEGKGCNKAGAPVRKDLPLHDMTGAGTWMPDAIIWLDGVDDLVMGGGLSAGQIQAMRDGQARALEHLQDAASLSVDGDTLTVVNLTGHKLISGYPEGRRMWLHITWYDGGSNIVREDGAYGGLEVMIEDQPTVVDTILDLEGTNTRIYQAKPGISQEWAAKLLTVGYDPGLPLGYDRVTGAVTMTLGELASEAPGSVEESFRFVLNNVLMSDNRIPPFGFRYDDAVTRNVLPVPADQYGDPGEHGIYDHFDTFTLVPPVGAVSADIELLYQATSWEYIQFLELANDGSVAFLAEEGEHMREAWMATGMAEPVVMASTTWSGAPNAWTDLGHALAGTQGDPLLVGTGTLVADSPLSLALTNARQGAFAHLVVGYDAVYLPFYGGTLVPDISPPGFFVTLFTDGGGTLVLNETWPPGVPPGFELYLQYWIDDPAAPAGLAASNAVVGTTP